LNFISPSLSQRIREKLPLLPELLLSESARKRIISFGDEWPHTATSFWGLELDLVSSQTQADLLFCIHRPEAYKAILEHVDNSATSDSEFVHQLKTLEELLSQDASLAKFVANIWFEYDYDFLERPARFPNFFFAPRKGVHPLMMVHAAEKIFGGLDMNFHGKRELALLMRLHLALPEHAWISQIGKMYLRNESSIRLFIQDVPTEDALPLLSKLGMVHIPSKEIQVLTSLALTHEARLGIDLDISERLGDGIGLEFYFSEMKQAIGFLEACPDVPEGKKAALVDYMKDITIDSRLQEQSFFSHFKWTHHPEKGSKLKSYVGWVENAIARSVIRTKPFKIIDHETV
jgi:hypothetical protein